MPTEQQLHPGIVPTAWPEDDEAGPLVSPLIWPGSKYWVYEARPGPVKSSIRYSFLGSGPFRRLRSPDAVLRPGPSNIRRGIELI